MLKNARLFLAIFKHLKIKTIKSFPRNHNLENKIFHQSFLFQKNKKSILPPFLSYLPPLSGIK